MTRLGILISGRGSNMVSLAQACGTAGFPAEVAVVVSNEPGAAGLGRARQMGLATAVIDHRGFPDRAAFDRELVTVLRAHDVDLVCLAGFMRLLGPGLIDAFGGRVLNIHPALLPSFPGLHAHEQALAYGVRWTGCTVHFVTEEMDAGPVLLQAAVPVHQDDDADTLSARVLEQEHRVYPEAVRLVASGRVQVQGRRVIIQEPEADE